MWLKKRDKECKKIPTKAKKEQYLQSLYENRTAELDRLRNDLMDYLPTITEKYPDKWGMQLPLSQSIDGEAYIVSLYITPQNDLIICYFFDTGEKTDKSRFISFFTGKILKEFNYQNSKKSDKPDNRIENYVAQNNFFKLPDLSSLKWLGFRIKGDDSYEGMLLRDGGRLIEKSKAPGGHCDKAIAHWFARYDKNGKEIFQKAIVRVTKKPRLFSTSTECYIMEGSDDGTAMIHSTTILPTFYELPDGTYIVTDSREPTIIRLKKDFTSPYIDSSDELLLVDAKEMFKKYDAVWTDVFGGTDADYGWLPEQLDWCHIKIECINIKMTEYFRELIAKKR